MWGRRNDRRATARQPSGRSASGRRVRPRRRLLAGSLVTVTSLLPGLLLAACTPTTGGCTVTSNDPACNLGAAGASRGVVVGAAVRASALANDSAYRVAVVTHYRSVTPESALKWATVEPSPGVFDFAQADAIVDFAAANGLRVRGHTLVWGAAGTGGVPAWVAGLPAGDLPAAVDAHIAAVVGRYAGRIDRWDVVNEPLAADGTLASNVFTAALGPGYVARAFLDAHQADPTAGLWLNESGTEYGSAKFTGLLSLVSDLLAAGVPLAGVGLEGHLGPTAPPVGLMRNHVAALRALGVRVAVTEADTPTVAPGGDAAQAARFAQLASESAAGGAEELDVWGVDDGHSFLDTLYGPGSAGTLLDTGYRPKTAYESVRAALASG